ncbi:MAG: hypothetical protein ABSD88_08410 [Candidatus Korobacteraceae bacterium]
MKTRSSMSGLFYCQLCRNAVIVLITLVALACSASAAEENSTTQPGAQPKSSSGSQASEALAPASATNPAIPETATAPVQLKVVLLKPLVRLENTRSGIKTDFGAATMFAPTITNVGLPHDRMRSDGSYESLLLNAAITGVGPKVTLLDPRKLEPSVVEACMKLGSLSSRLARGNVNEEALKALASLDEQSAILVHFLRVEGGGPGRSWNPNSGAITSSTDSTLIQAALISGKTGKVIWKGERLIRYKALKPTDEALGKVLTELYGNFDIK